jgi:hypothetical protein
MLKAPLLFEYTECVLIARLETTPVMGAVMPAGRIVTNAPLAGEVPSDWSSLPDIFGAASLRVANPLSGVFPQFIITISAMKKTW